MNDRAPALDAAAPPHASAACGSSPPHESAHAQVQGAAPYIDDLRWAVSEVRARPSAAAQPLEARY